MSVSVDPHDVGWILRRLCRVDTSFAGPPWPLQLWDDDTETWQEIGLPRYRFVHVTADTTLPSAPILAIVDSSSCTVTLPKAAACLGLTCIVKTQDVHDSIVKPPAGETIDRLRTQRRLFSYRSATYLSDGSDWWETTIVKYSE